MEPDKTTEELLKEIDDKKKQLKDKLKAEIEAKRLDRKNALQEIRDIISDKDIKTQKILKEIYKYNLLPKRQRLVTPILEVIRDIANDQELEQEDSQIKTDN